MTRTVPIIRVVLAVFDPQPRHLEAQITSIAAQTDVHVELHAVISDLISGPAVETAARARGLSCHIHIPAKKTGAVAAFEFGLAEALKTSGAEDYFALSDQDDIWHFDKLARSVAALRARPGCHLVHADARLVDDAGQVVAKSMFRHEGRDRRTGLRRLLYRNSITGMTALFTREVVSHALPFPRQSGTFYYHDLWLGLVAAAKGPIACLRRPSVDYRQHGGNVVGAVSGKGDPRMLTKPWLRKRFGSFSLACYLAKSLMLRVEQVVINEPEAFDRKRLARLRPYLRHYGLGASFFADSLGYALRGYRELADHSFSQGVVKAGRMVWAGRRMLSLDFENRLKEFDDVGYSLAPGSVPTPASHVAGAMHSTEGTPQAWFTFLDGRKSAPWQVILDPARPAICTILVPTLNPTEIFAGIATALDLGIGLARRGMGVRFVATDLPMVSEGASRNFIGDRIGLRDRSAALGRIELACGVTSTSLSFSPAETLVATAWWSAHVANSVINHPGIFADRFHYLIQDFEPNFYAWGTDYAGAMESYAMPCVPIFNTTLLWDFFREQGFTFGGAEGLAFRPSIDIGRYASLKRVAGRSKRRIAVYGRPEVPRNMFPVCIEALAELVHSQGLTAEDTEIVSVGLAHDPIVLPGNLTLQSLGKLPMEEYPLFLSTVDIGLSLMYSPHPSHLPLEMAAAGARVVTNGFGPKDLSKLSPLIHSVDPTPASVAKALIDALGEMEEEAMPAARDFDLSSLGRDLDEVAEDLFAALAVSNARRRVA